MQRLRKLNESIGSPKFGPKPGPLGHPLYLPRTLEPSWPYPMARRSRNVLLPERIIEAPSPAVEQRSPLPLWIHDRRNRWSTPLRFRKDPVERLLIHRVGGPTFADDVDALVPQLLEYWGGLVAYSYLVDRRGWVFCLADNHIVTPHAWHQNCHAIGVGFIGDFRQEELALFQFAGGVHLMTWLLARYPAATIGGHTDTPGATKNPNKECPGARFRMDEFLNVVWEERIRILKAETR